MDANFRVTPDLYATKGQRFLNVLIDYCVRMAIGFVLAFGLILFAESTESFGLYDWLISDSKLNDYIFGIILILIYYSIIEGFTGRSVGKYITKTKVVLENGSKPNFSEVLIRTFCRMIPFDAFSFLGDQAYGWHDSLSKTYVVDIAKFEAKKDAANEIDEIGKLPEEI